MPNKAGKFTRSERIFVDTMARTGNPAFSGREAGYANASGPSLALQRPAIQNAIGDRIAKGLEDMLTPAFGVLKWAMTDDRVPANARIKAATYVIDKLNGDKGVDAKSPDDMTASELAQFAEKSRLQLMAAEQRLAEQAKDITPSEPDSLLD